MAAGIPLRHPESGGEYLAVDEDHVAALALKGWERVPDADEPKAAAPPAQPPVTPPRGQRPAPTPTPEA